MSTPNQEILIIGGCGYIGSRLFQYLQKKSYIVDTIDLEWFGNYVNPNNIRKNFNSLTPSFLKKYDTIILLAGHSSIPMSEKNIKSTFKNNVANFISLLHKIDHQKFIYASSSSVYGHTKEFEVTEEHDRYTPTNVYDLTKKEIDYYASLSTLQVFGLRMGTVCGYSPNLRTDVMINKMFHMALQEKEIIIFNKNFFRPILGMNDFCRSVETIIKKTANPGLYNIASFNASIEEIAKEVVTKLPGTKITSTGRDKTYYNFSISTKKFEQAFNFTFSDTVETIVESLQKQYHKAAKTVRV